MTYRTAAYATASSLGSSMIVCDDELWAVLCTGHVVNRMMASLNRLMMLGVYDVGCCIIGLP